MAELRDDAAGFLSFLLSQVIDTSPRQQQASEPAADDHVQPSTSPSEPSLHAYLISHGYLEQRSSPSRRPRSESTVVDCKSPAPQRRGARRLTEAERLLLGVADGRRDEAYWNPAGCFHIEDYLGVMRMPPPHRALRSRPLNSVKHHRSALLAIDELVPLDLQAVVRGLPAAARNVVSIIITAGHRVRT